MENLSLSNILDFEAVSFLDDGANEHADSSAPRTSSASRAADSAVRLLDGLSAYAAVFGCAGTCHA